MSWPSGPELSTMSDRQIVIGESEPGSAKRGVERTNAVEIQKGIFNRHARAAGQAALELGASSLRVVRRTGA